MAPPRKTSSVMGPPTIAELHYLAALLDQGGSLSRQGLRLRCSSEVGQWLVDRFGGIWYATDGGCWWLRQQLELREALERVAPYVLKPNTRGRIARFYMTPSTTASA